MNVHIITIGDELLIGQVINTNASWIGEQLILQGAHVVRTVTLPDTRSSIEKELRYSTTHADLTVITGGLGPTHDDVTRDALAAFLGRPLILNEDVLASIRSRFEKRKRTMPERNRVQAMVPEGCEVLENPVGTAPGLWYSGAGYDLCVLPGVPHEMQSLTASYLIPRIRRDTRTQPIAQRTLHTLGIGESHLQELLGDVRSWLPSEHKLAFLPGLGGVRLRITASGEDSKAALANLQSIEGTIRNRVGVHIFGTDRDILEAKIGELLKSLNLTISTAESCTGGLIGDRITNVSGSSQYFKGGIIAYCNQVKHDLLGVDQATLAEHGAVSKRVALRMAIGVRERLQTDIGVSATGIMGPTGGTLDKPIGTVWIGYADAHSQLAERILTQKDRRINKKYAAMAVLRILWRKLQKLQLSEHAS